MMLHGNLRIEKINLEDDEAAVENIVVVTLRDEKMLV